MKQKKSISSPKKGMNLDANISQLQNVEYKIAYNSNTNNETGDGFNIQNEPSNYLGIVFPLNYKVIHHKLDLLKNKTYFFLTNPTTKKSSIGYVNNTILDTYNEDLQDPCEECEKSNLLEIPLENSTQTPSLTYIEILNDNCLPVGQGFNFDINYPIKKSEIKQEKLGTVIYFNDNRNPRRHINLTNIEENPTSHYLITQEVPCDDPIITNCILIDKLLIEPKHNRLVIQADAIQIGGNLKMGSYEFRVAYCDIGGNEMAEYSTSTNPIKIFDENNNIQSQTETDQFTNFAIKLKVKNLDILKFKYYKVVCIERNNVNNTASPFVDGVYPTSNDTILYTHSGSASDDLYVTSGNISVKRRIDFYELNAVKPHYEKFKTIMSSGNRLWHGGGVKKEEINIQPVVNLLSSLVKWESTVAKHDLYNNPIATSKYVQYRRDEVQPFAIRLINKDGSYSANFPIIARPANNDDLTTISDANFSSLNANTPQCAVNNRTKKWQIKNTAKVTKDCSDIIDGGLITFEDTFKTCTINAVATIPAQTTPLYFPLDSGFSNIKDYINDNPTVIFPVVSGYLNNPYSDNHCPPIFESGCTPPSLVTTDSQNNPLPPNNEIGVINGEVSTPVYKTEGEYIKIKAPTTCNIYTINTDGTIQTDANFTNECFNPCTQQVYYRDRGSVINESCESAEDVINITDPNNINISYFHNYNYSPTYSDLLINTHNATPSTGFSDKLQSGALWFRIDKAGRNKLIFEISKGKCATIDSVPAENTKMRYTFYVDCTGTVGTPAIPLSVNGAGGSQIVDTSIGSLLEIDTTNYPNTFYVAIDVPIISTQRYALDCTPTGEIRYRTTPICGCFSVVTRNIDQKGVNLTWSSITINKIETYKATCQSIIPKVDECKPKAYKKGIFSYWQSTENYPDNKQLYDSSQLKIRGVDLIGMQPIEIIEFIDYYIDSSVVTSFISGNTYVVNLALGDDFSNVGGFVQSGTSFIATNTITPLIYTSSQIRKITVDVNKNFVLKKDSNNEPITDFTCKNIRHPKFPDNKVSPFIYSNSTFKNNADTIIFPLGINLDSKVVISMLKIALNNNLITQKEYDNVQGYEILKGDNSIHKSVIASGLGFDNYNYQKNKETWWYSNMPFNDLGEDKLNLTEKDGQLIQHPYGGTANHSYTFLSPDTALTKPTLPTEVTLTGYQFGSSRSRVVDVERHPKYTILGEEAYDRAKNLVYLEAAVELLIKVGELTSQQWLVAGVSSGGSFGGVAGIAAVSAGYVASEIIKLGRYRYQWLETFENLGTADNFTAQQVAEGQYNRFVVNTNESDYIRGLPLRKYLKGGLLSTIDESTGERVNINSDQREYSVLLSTGEDYKFNYLAEYVNYDNNNKNSNSSKYITCEKDEESFRNIASPYFTLKNYIPDQWGKIDSIEWLTTNYIFDLSDNTVCTPIFGGTCYISPYSVKRKMPIFRGTAMGTADKSPFRYSQQNNVGYPKYFLDYKVGGTYTRFPSPFPDINSEYSFICEAGRRDYYLRPPSKIILYTFGIVEFMVESEINCHFRYARPELKDQFYRKGMNVNEWTQESKLPISEPNTFFYNNTYSLPVSKSPYKFLDYTYDKEIWRKRNIQTNGVLYSEADINENGLLDNWLVYKPLNFKEFSTKYGKLIDIKSLESEQIMLRFEDGFLIINSQDNLLDKITPQNKETGLGGIFAQRPQENTFADLGIMGTQNTDICSTPFGHYFVDAKRGKIFEVSAGGKQVAIVSEQVGNQPTNTKNWFREHLPFKILKQFPNIDIDNKYKGLGMNIWYDDRNGRVFFTKRDYVAKNTTCLEYEQGIGFYNACIPPTISCGIGYTYNPVTQLCEKPGNCLLNLTARVYYTNIPPFIGHVCNKARFNLITNGVNIGIVNLNNANGTTGEEIDEFNIIPQGSQLSRETYLTYSTQNINDIIASPSGANTLTLSLQCRDPLQLNGCHSNIAQIDLYSSGVLVYTGVISAGTTVNFDPCNGTPDVITQPPTIVNQTPPIYFDNTEYFEDVSWTVSFKPGEGWGSFFSFYPDYSPFSNNYFQAGYNWGQDQGTLWNHTMNNKSFQVFQGRLHPFYVEFPIQNENAIKMLNSISLNVEAKRYQGAWDFSEHNDIGFNKISIWNNTQHSGILNLNVQKSLADLKNYPKTNTNNTQDIIFTTENNQHNINYFFNRVVNQGNNVPIFAKDKNNIFKTLTNGAISFTGKRVLERIKGDTFMVGVTNDKESRFNIILKNTINDETIID